MKKTLVIALAAVLATGAAQAQYSLSTDMTFATDYVFRGIKLADNTFHPSIELSQDNFYGGIWGALPLENRGSNGYSDEWDIYAGYTPQLSDTLSMDIGFTHYRYPALDGADTTEAFVGVNSDLSGFTPGIYGYYDFDLKTLTIQGNVGTSLPLDAIGTSLDLSGYVGYVKPDKADSYAYYGVGVSLPFKLNETATLTIAGNWATNDIEGADDNFFFLTAGLTMGF